MKKQRPVLFRPLFGLLILVVAGIFAKFEYWPAFGVSLTLSTVILITGYLEGLYRRIEQGFSRLEEILESKEVPRAETTSDENVCGDDI